MQANNFKQKQTRQKTNLKFQFFANAIKIKKIKNLKPCILHKRQIKLEKKKKKKK